MRRVRVKRWVWALAAAGLVVSTTSAQGFYFLCPPEKSLIQGKDKDTPGNPPVPPKELPPTELPPIPPTESVPEPGTALAALVGLSALAIAKLCRRELQRA